MSEPRKGLASSSTYNNQVFWEPKYLRGHGHLAPDIPLCSQVLYWLIVDPPPPHKLQFNLL